MKSGESMTTDLALEKLVDGELSAAETRRLLQALDARPQDWKRLAVLFLEAQAWRSDLTAIAAPPPAATKSAAVAGANFSWLGTLAAAASLLLGLGIGVNIAGRREAVIAAGPAQSPAVAVDNQPGHSSPSHVVEEQTVSIPVYEHDIDPGTLWSSSAALPEDLVAQARRRHHEVRREFQVVPIRLQDGRRAAVPVELVKFVPTPTY